MKLHYRYIDHFLPQLNGMKFPNFRSVDSEVSFVIYACFTVSYCCIGDYVGNYYVDIINWTIQLIVLLNKWKLFYTKFMYLKASADVKISTFFEKNGRDEAVDHEMDL